MSMLSFFLTIIVIVNQIKYTSRFSKQIGKAGVGLGQSFQAPTKDIFHPLPIVLLGQKVCFFFTLFKQLARKHTLVLVTHACASITAKPLWLMPML